MKSPAGKYNFIAIEGNIGAGKTTFSTMIAEEYNAQLILERFEDNSFLPKFYQEPDKYAFPLEMSFLADRYQQLKEQLSARDLFKSFTISDYFLDKSLIFAKNNLSADEFALYNRLFNIISSSLPKPDLIFFLYLDIHRLVSNIDNRGRDYEKLIKRGYLERIQAGYLNHFRTLTESRIVIIDTNGIDFVASPEHYQLLRDLLQKDFPVGINRIEL